MASATAASPSSAPALTEAQAEALVASAMLTPKAMAVVGLVPTVAKPVLQKQEWFPFCKAQISSDSQMSGGGYQQWQKGKSVVVLEAVLHYPSGVASTALAEVKQALQYCTTTEAGGITFTVLKPISQTDDSVTFCLQDPNNFACDRVVRRGDVLDELIVFGNSKTNAQKQLQLISGLADAQLEHAKL